MVVYFAFLLHIYQPPVQIAPVIRQIVKESYRPVLDALLDHPQARITLNINGTLTEQLHDYGFDDVIEKITTLASRNQIEFTGSAKFHPLLPLVPEPEVIRQIELNTQTNQNFFGQIYQPKGFFPPEMAVSDEILPIIKNMGYEWLIMSGIANTLPEFPTTFFSTDPTGLIHVFRDDYISIDCAFDKINTVDSFINRIKYKNQNHDYYVVLAMDGETFGHHVKHAIKNFLIPLFEALPQRQDVKLCTISELITHFKTGAIQKPKASSWSTMPYDLDRKVPFPLWFDPNNPLHIEQHRLLMFGLTMIHLAEKYREQMDDEKKSLLDNARNLLDRAIHSCQQWWASKRPWYSPDMILRGINEIFLAVINAKRSIPESAPDIKGANELILEEMLKTQNKIIRLLG